MEGQCAATFSSQAKLSAVWHLWVPKDTSGVAQEMCGIVQAVSFPCSLRSSRVNQTGLDPMGSNYRKVLQVPYPRQTVGLGMWGQVPGEGINFVSSL